MGNIIIPPINTNAAEEGELIPTCCESVNNARTVFTRNLGVVVESRVVPDGFQLLHDQLELIHKIKTKAYKSFAKLQNLKINDECCQAIALGINAIASITLFIAPLLEGCDLEEFLSLYKKALRLLLNAACGGKTRCCIGVGSGIVNFAQGILAVESAPIPLVTPKQILNVEATLLRALAKLLKKGKRDCCAEAGEAIGKVSAGVLSIISNLTSARNAGYFGENPDRAQELYQQEVQQELRVYKKVLVLILEASSSKCARCCAEVVSGIGLLYSGIEGDIPSVEALQNGLGGLGPKYFSQVEVEPVPPTEFYLHYLNVIDKIRKITLKQYEVILDCATKKECCKAVSNGLALTTLAFLTALANLFITLTNSLNTEPDPILTLKEAIALLDEFAKEYPPLSEQIVDGVEPEECKSSSSSSSTSCSDSSKSSESCTSSKRPWL